MFKKFTIPILLLLIAFSVSGCIKVETKKKKAAAKPAGVYKTINKGNSWKAKILIPTVSGKPKTIAAYSATVLTLDPQDHKAIYFGTPANGLFYSYNGAESWWPAESLGNIRIEALAIDPHDKCTIYVASKNQVLASTDCTRSWNSIYVDTDKKLVVTSILVKEDKPNYIYLGTSRGDLILSSDQGKTWRVINRWRDKIAKLIASPHNPNIIFVATQKKGLYRTQDAGLTWESLNEQLKEFKGANNFIDLAVSPAEKGFLLLAHKYGLLRSTDYGESWEKINLLVPEKKAAINAVVVDPKNIDNFYYVTSTTFYRTQDGGQTWTPKKIPTSHSAWRLAIDPQNPNVLYMGFKVVKKK
jgi:photosystem II stability/assembly factor-like uncharacterized protein